MSISRRVKLNATASNYRREFHFCLWERSCISKWPLMLAGKMTVNSQDLLEIAVIFYNLHLIVSLLSLLPCLWGILLGRKSLSVNDQLSFHNLYDMFGLQTCQTNCLLQANTPALHLRVGSKHHGKYGSHVPQQRKLMPCLLQPFFQVFSYKFVCLLQGRLVCFHIYRPWCSQNTLSYLTLTIWNNLTTCLKLSNSLNSFKHVVKEHFFKKLKNKEQEIFTY